MNNKIETNHTGYINLKENRHFAYEIADGMITIHAYEKIPEIENQQFILTEGHDNNSYLIYSQLPISMASFDLYPQNYPHNIDWVIKNYKDKSTFNAVIFDFAELQYFCPSASVVKRVGNEVIFDREPEVIKEFNIEVGGICCHISFEVSCYGKYGLSHSHMEALSRIIVSFPETDDMGFIEDIYYIVDSVFAFLFNRRNTDCLSMELKGNYNAKTLELNEIVDVVKSYHCQMYFLDKYREEPEEEKTIEKAFNAFVIFNYIEKLFEFVSEDICNSNQGKANISISSIHPSLSRRNLIDLQQSLHITGAFEFYVRRYLPEMVEEKSHHTALKKVLKDFADENTGEAKKLAKNLAKNVVREPSLKDKIVKVYKGYKEWYGVKDCLEDEWFSEDINKLAQSANDWRNELAHEKRSYEPSIDVIRAIRLVEHLNYIIVLRQLGCKDSEIKGFLTNVLTR